MTLLAPIVMVSCELLVPQLFPCGQWISQAWNPHGHPGERTDRTLGRHGVADAGQRRLVRSYCAIRAPPAIRRWPPRRCWRAALIFGAVRMRQIDAIVAHAPRLKVGLVQPNFAYTIDGEFSRDEALRQLTALQEQSRRLEKAGAQLLVWSEGSFPMAVPRDFSADFPAESLAMIRRGFSVPTMIGAEMYDAAREDAFNSAILLDRNGKVARTLRQSAAAGLRRVHPGHRDLSVAAKISARGGGKIYRGHRARRDFPAGTCGTASGAWVR